MPNIRGEPRPFGLTKPPQGRRTPAADRRPPGRRTRREQRTLRFAPGRFRQRIMPRHAHARRGRETERRPGRRRRKNFLAAVRLKPLDHNRLHVCATRYRTPRGSACSRTLRRLTLSLDQTVTRKKFSGAIPHKTKEQHHAFPRSGHRGETGRHLWNPRRMERIRRRGRIRQGDPKRNHRQRPRRRPSLLGGPRERHRPHA